MLNLYRVWLCFSLSTCDDILFLIRHDVRGTFLGLGSGYDTPTIDEGEAGTVEASGASEILSVLLPRPFLDSPLLKRAESFQLPASLTTTTVPVFAMKRFLRNYGCCYRLKIRYRPPCSPRETLRKKKRSYYPGFGLEGLPMLYQWCCIPFANVYHLYLPYCRWHPCHHTCFPCWPYLLL